METSIGPRRLPAWVPWTAVFGANLIVPLLLGWGATADGGRAGMFAAMGMLWLLGYACCLRSRVAERVLRIGGTVVALTQFAPYLQFGAGAVSFRIVQRLGFGAGFWRLAAPDVEVPIGQAGEFGGFLMTTFTGGLLLAVALAVGLFGRWVIGPPGAGPASDGASGIRPAG